MGAGVGEAMRPSRRGATTKGAKAGTAGLTGTSSSKGTSLSCVWCVCESKDKLLSNLISSFFLHKVAMGSSSTGVAEAGAGTVGAAEEAGGPTNHSNRSSSNSSKGSTPTSCRNWRRP